MIKMYKKLYDNYMSVSDDDIRNHLKRIQIFKKVNGSFFKINDTTLEKVLENPRNISLTYDADNIKETETKNLINVKKIKYLCKSTSRFFLKADIGEVFDQINPSELENIIGICINNLYEGPINDEGDHFIMNAWLLRYNRKEKLTRLLDNAKT